MLRKITDLLLKPASLLAAYVLFAVGASIQALLIGKHIKDGFVFTDYNNYIIFKNSFFHLLAGKNLYVLYLAEQADLYKYSPTFALFMAPLAYLPDVIGLSIWNVINALALLFSIRMLPFTGRVRSLLSWFLLLELLTSMQNAQSNGLMAGLIIAAYACMQRDKVFLAALWIILATFIKIYGCIAFCLFLFYPGRLKQISYAAFWMVVFAAIPLIVITPQALAWQYQNWSLMLAADKAASYGLSVMGWLHSWFGINKGKDVISILGLLILLTPLVRWKMYINETFRLLFLASLLVWVIIFNYKAESPTFIIAVAGVGIRHFVMPKRLCNNILLATVFIFTCLSPTDIFPPFMREHFFIPYTIKAIPCILAWCIITVELLTLKDVNALSQISQSS